MTDDVGDSRSCQACAEDEHGPDRYHGGVGEAGYSLGRRYKACQNKRSEHHERDEIHSDLLADEQCQRDDQNEEYEADLKRQFRLS